MILSISTQEGCFAKKEDAKEVGYNITLQQTTGKLMQGHGVNASYPFKKGRSRFVYR